MTAVNPMPPTAPQARDQRGYEPSMEEILASIRRIIADDQSLPGRDPAAEPAAVVAPAPMASEPSKIEVRALRPVEEPVERLTPSIAVAIESGIGSTEPVKPSPQRPVEPHTFTAHGTIAPQFATPDGPFQPEPRQVPVARENQAALAAAPQRMPPPHQDVPKPTPREIEPAMAVAEPHDDLEPAASQPALNESNYDKPLGRHEPIPFEPASLISPATDQALVAAFNTLAASRLTENTDELLAMTREMIRPLLKTWLDDNLPSMVERLVRAEIERVARGNR